MNATCDSFPLAGGDTSRRTFESIMTASKFRLALIQFASKANKYENLRTASLLIEEAALNAAKIVCLPALFGYPVRARGFREAAETIPGETSDMLSHSAKQHGIYLIGGSMTEIDNNGRRYNSCLVYGPDGSMIAKHRKIHLFKVDIPGVLTMREADHVLPGKKLSTFDTPFCRVGVGICNDLRSASLAQKYAQLGCKLLVYPGSFGMITGPLHWELLSRSRANDNQVYVASVSPARDEMASYIAWGHSMLVDPTGKVVQSAGISEEILISEVDLDYLVLVRKQMPTAGQE